MANQGTITLNFESPDINLTGMGEFDISQTFRSLFEGNTDLKEQISNKIIEIVKNIKTDVVAENWTQYLETTFGLGKDVLKLPTSPKSSGIRNDLESKYKKFFIDKPWLDYVKFFSSANVDYTKYLKFFASGNFGKMITQLTSAITVLDTTVQALHKSKSPMIRGIGDKLESTRTPSIPAIDENAAKGKGGYRSEIQEVVISDFTDKALEKLANIFNLENLEKMLRPKKEEENTGLSKWQIAAAVGVALAALPFILQRLGVGEATSYKIGWFHTISLILKKMGGRIIAVLEKEGLEGLLRKGFQKFFSGIAKLVYAPFKMLDSFFRKIPFITDGVEKMAGPFERIIKANFGKIANKISDFFILIGKHIGGFFRDISTYIGSRIKGFFTTIITKIIPSFGKEGAETVVKTAGPAVAKTLLGQAFERVKKWIPGVGFALSMWDMYKRLKAGDFFGAFLCLGSGIANLVSIFPPALPIATAISIMLDLFNAGRDIKAGGMVKHSTTGVNQWLGKSLVPLLRKLPFIGTAIYLGEAIGNLITGEWKAAAKALAMAGIVSIPGLGFLISEERLSKAASTTVVNVKGASGWLQNTLYPHLKKIPIIGTIIHLREAIGHLVGGKWDAAKTSFAAAGINISAIDFIFNIGKSIATQVEGVGDAWRELKDAWKRGLKDFLPLLKKKFYDATVGPLVNAFTTIKDALTKILDPFVQKFKDFFDWVEEIPTRVKNSVINKASGWMPDWVKNRFSSEVIPMKESGKEPIVTVKDSNPIRILPSRNDKAHTLSDGKTVMAEKGGVLDKKLDDVVNAIKSLQIVMSTTNKTFALALDPVVAQLKNISNLNGQQLQMLPALAKSSNPETTYPSADVRDPIYDYRTRVHNNLARRM